MPLADLRFRREADVLSRCVAWTRTLEYTRLLDETYRAIEDWLSQCARPAVSVSGGKDSTLLLRIVRAIEPSIPVYHARPRTWPKPLSLDVNRFTHTEQLRIVSGGEWHVEEYVWDVEAVLNSRVSHPSGLKVRTLEKAMRRDGVDGIALGLRAAESRARRMHLASRGLVYRRKDGIVVAQPIARWTAEQVIGGILAVDVLPLNPVYSRLSGIDSLEHLRDGGWWPVHRDQRAWLATHFSDCLPYYDRAVLLGEEKSLVEWST